MKIKLLFIFISLSSNLVFGDVADHQWALQAKEEAQKIIERALIEEKNKVSQKGCASKLLKKDPLKELAQRELNPQGPQLLVFVSFSMPIDGLKSLIQEVDKAGGTVLVRGLKENSFSKTAQVLKDMGVRVQIDPQAFTEYQITVVPTFVVRSGKKVDRLSGYVNLNYVLEEFLKSGEVEGAKRFLEKLRGKA